MNNLFNEEIEKQDVEDLNGFIEDGFTVFNSETIWEEELNKIRKYPKTFKIKESKFSPVCWITYSGIEKEFVITC